MSSSTESMSKGEEKKGNSENNPKDDMPKEDTTVESNSKGARPKTSSWSKKSKEETVVETQYLTVLIMNASGDNQGTGTATRRIQTIEDIIKKHNPDLILFQEFTWKKVLGKKWKSDPVLKHFQHTGNKDASIMFNINKLNVIESTDIKLQGILEELQSSISTHETPTAEEKPIGELQRIPEELQRLTIKNPTPISPDFDPIPRMSLRVVKTMGVPVLKFICISWHGEHTGLNNEEKVTEFKYLMIFVEKIYVTSHLPLLIGGDFNVDRKLICHEVKDPFTLYNCVASKRRENKEIDYFIATTELDLSHMTPVDLKEDSKAEKPEEVLDHDPIKAMLEPARLSALDKVTVKISKRAK